METPEEKKRRIIEQKLISTSPRRNGKVNIKYKELLKEMQRLTGYKTSQQISPGAILGGSSYKNFMPPNMYTAYENVFKDAYEPKDNRIVVFYGFNGMLAQKYSIVEEMNREEIIARMQFAGDKVPYSIKNYTEFKPVIKQMEGALKEITFDDAMNIIRIGIESTKVEEFEDAEQDEFDDNCIATCKPGNHDCGK